MTNTNGNRYYLHYDQVGSLRAVSDASHNIVKEITYDTYGNILSDSNPSFKVPFRFAGGLYDPDTKLTHFGYREYDAYTGKWTAKDPILFAGGDSNLYGYVLNDPVNLSDPLGLWIPQAIGAIIGGGLEVYNNGWSWNVAVAAAAGAIGGFGSSIGKAAAFGALGSGSYNAYQQSSDPCKDFDWEELARSSALGAVGSGFGGALGNMGKSIKNYNKATPIITNIKYPTIEWEGSISNYERAGAAAGAVIGGAISNSGGASW